ncbi:hypothetical protein SAY86_013865 [Trapa natans]|uniref:Uncharacterized protein n=1 Tax=Trapa natans TaxID=22666 RepID=A0AAN7KY32_TRANT|nr:hypothetical protein SAY86_013865 [Trapa natans]
MYDLQEVHVLGASPTAGREALLVTSADADDVIGSRVVIRREEEERVRLDRSYSSSSMEEAPGSAYHRPWHCIRLAGMAFIKCFGLGSRGLCFTPCIPRLFLLLGSAVLLLFSDCAFMRSRCRKHVHTEVLLKVETFRFGLLQSIVFFLSNTVYAPVKSGALMFEERVIYILGCLTLACGKTTLSWRALRIQKPCFEENESNAAHGSAVPSFEPSEPSKEARWWEDFDEEDNEDMDLEELGRALSEAATSASNHKKQSDNPDSCTVENPSSLKSTLPDYDSNVTGGLVHLDFIDDIVHGVC